MLNEENFLSHLHLVTPQWIAGFFDGEGCVHARIESNGCSRLRVTISQKEQHILMLIALKFPPSRFETRSQKIKNGGTIKYRTLYWNGSSAVSLLNAIKDFVIVKKELVENALKFTSLMTDTYYNPSKEAIKEREDIVERITTINQAKRVYEN